MAKLFPWTFFQTITRSSVLELENVVSLLSKSRSFSKLSKQNWYWRAIKIYEQKLSHIAPKTGKHNITTFLLPASFPSVGEDPNLRMDCGHLRHSKTFSLSSFLFQHQKLWSTWSSCTLTKGLAVYSQWKSGGHPAWIQHFCCLADGKIAEEHPSALTQGPLSTERFIWP